MTEAAEEALGDLIRDLTVEVKTLSKKFERTRRATAAQWAVSVLVVIALLGVGVFALRANASINCIRDWANATSARSSKVGQLSSDRSDALDDLAFDVLFKASDAKGKADTAAYVKARNAYVQARQLNPVPTVSSFGCTFLL